MIQTSRLFQESMRYSRTMFTEVDIVRNGITLENDIPINDGKVTTDRGSNTRYSASVDIPLPTWRTLPFDADGTRLRIRRGVESIGVREAVAVGTYQIYDFKRTNRGVIGVTCKGLENVLIEGRFEYPRTPAYGISTVLAITQLIVEVDPLAEVVALNSYDKRVTATAPWERERQSAVNQLATSINAEVFCGHDGRWYIVDAPDLYNLVPIFLFDVGETGVVVEQQVSRSREGVYNAAIVSGQSSDSSVPAVSARAIDNDPNSKTYYYGTYGKVPRFYSSQFFTNEVQCQVYANRLLAESLAPNNKVSVTSGPIPLLEAGDPVMNRLLDQPDQTYLLQKTDLPLGNGTWGGEMLTQVDPEQEAA